MKKVSVIIPCHNGEQWLEESIRSAFAQGDCEVIVVVDSSSDQSLQIAQSISGVCVLEGNWGNGNSARNAGLQQASGEWVQFLDADDYLLPNKIEGQLSEVKSETDVIYSPISVRDEGEDSVTKGEGRVSEDEIELWLRWELCQTGAALWKRESLGKIGGWKEGLPCCQDNEVTLRALREGLHFQFVDKPGAVYRIWSEGTVCRKNPQKVITQKTKLIDACLRWLEDEKRMSEGYREVVGESCFEMARTLAKYDLSEANTYFKERKARGLMKVTGPAAPLRYKLLAKTVGFGAAEKIAKILR